MYETKIASLLSRGGTLVIRQKSNKGYIIQMLLRFLIFWPLVFARLYNSIESIALGLRERQNNTLKEKTNNALKSSLPKSRA